MTKLSSFFSVFSSTGPLNSALNCNDVLKLERPRMKHFKQWRQVRSDNKVFLQPWEPTWPLDALTKKAFKYRVKYVNKTAREKAAFSYVLVHKDAGIIGGISLYNIRLGSSMTGTIGYWLAQKYNGQGHMGAALNRICQFGFNSQKLSRIESACLQSNSRSIKLLKKVGFKQEGLGGSYLEINGKRSDHLLFSKIKDKS